MQVGGLGLIPYRTIQFYNEQYALWQVEENRTLVCIADGGLKIRNRKSQIKNGLGL